jgi:hypothetical protein
MVIPWERMDKTELVRWYLQHGYPVEYLKRTWACYRPASPSGLPCGNCPACIRRYIAFTLNGIEESYEENPRLSSASKEYIRRAKAKEYSAGRCTRILEALDGD